MVITKREYFIRYRWKYTGAAYCGGYTFAAPGSGGVVTVANK